MARSLAVYFTQIVAKSHTAYAPISVQLSVRFLRVSRTSGRFYEPTRGRSELRFIICRNQASKVLTVELRPRINLIRVQREDSEISTSSLTHVTRALSCKDQDNSAQWCTPISERQIAYAADFKTILNRDINGLPSCASDFCCEPLLSGE